MRIRTVSFREPPDWVVVNLLDGLEQDLLGHVTAELHGQLLHGDAVLHVGEDGRSIPETKCIKVNKYRT